ncbi:hypothetical protein AOLI_G00009150 [Acnodon oligacanthus]
MLTDWIEWSGDWSYDCKGQNLLLKYVSHWKSSGAEQLIFQRNILSLGLSQFGGTMHVSWVQRWSSCLASSA